MIHTIELPQDTYIRLNKLAAVFNVTPVDVINNLLNNLETSREKQDKTKDKAITATKKDFTTYLFSGKEYRKGQLVLAVVREYVSKNEKITFNELSDVFPKVLQGSIGVFNTLEYVKNKYKDKKIKRHFIKDHQIIKLHDSLIAVCTEWGAGVTGNIDTFIDNAKSVGLHIQANKK